MDVTNKSIIKHANNINNTQDKDDFNLLQIETRSEWNIIHHRFFPSTFHIVKWSKAGAARLSLVVPRGFQKVQICSYHQ